MGYSVSAGRFDALLSALGQSYDVFAPKVVRGQKNKYGDALVRYGQVSSFEEIVWDRPSDFSPKEVYYPIVQTLFYLGENECTESELESDRGAILLMRPCDINAIERLDKIFLENGGQADSYYQRRREKLVFFLLECAESFDECFCASMGTGHTNNYSVALRFGPDGALAEVRDEAFAPFFQNEPPADYTPAFIKANAKRVALPNIGDASLIKPIHDLDYWKGFDENSCLGCGGCNTVCPTCSCFDTVDVIYNETSLEGERRRVWSSCMLEGFTVMAGGHGVRGTPGARMRFKTLHKVHDFQRRFGCEGHMCVGCGRCEKRCPRDIRFSEIIDHLADEVEALLPTVKLTDAANCVEVPR